MQFSASKNRNPICTCPWWLRVIATPVQDQMLSWYLLVPETPPSRSDFHAVFLGSLYIELEKYPGVINWSRDCKCWLDEQGEKTDNPFNFHFYESVKNFFHKQVYKKKAAKIDFLSPATVKYLGWSMHQVQIYDDGSMYAHSFVLQFWVFWGCQIIIRLIFMLWRYKLASNGMN